MNEATQNTIVVRSPKLKNLHDDIVFTSFCVVALCVVCRCEQLIREQLYSLYEFGGMVGG